MCTAAAELARVPGIGKKSAERIQRATHTELARKDEDADMAEERRRPAEARRG